MKFPHCSFYAGLLVRHFDFIYPPLLSTYFFFVRKLKSCFILKRRIVNREAVLLCANVRS
jgi:hypothetical protein